MLQFGAQVLNRAQHLVGFLRPSPSGTTRIFLLILSNFRYLFLTLLGSDSYRTPPWPAAARFLFENRTATSSPDPRPGPAPYAFDVCLSMPLFEPP